VFVLKMVFGFGGKKKEKKEARPASVAESVNPEVIPLAPSELPVIPAIKPDSAKKSSTKPNSAKTPNSAKPKSKSVVVKKTKDIPEKTRQSMPDKLKPLNTQDSTKKSTKAHKSKPKSTAKCVENEKYMPPSKLLKHLDPDAKKKKPNNQVLSTQVNRLLKQNTQDLFGNLTSEVRKAFETLFDRIDVTDSGGITAKEIQQLIKKHTNKNLTLQQVQNVLRDLDVKGTGDIEFDEFIFMLSQPSNYVRLFDKRELKGLANKETQKFLEQNQKQDENDTTFVFFEALRNATKQDSMTALRTFYKNRLKKLNDHVIHDWSAGQRCIGLSDQEMLKRYETIQGELLRQRVNFCKDNSYKTSPYARPLEWGVMNLREAIIARRKLAQEINTVKPDPRRVKMSEFVVTPKAVPLPRYVIKKRSPLKRTFNYDQLASIRDKVDNIAKTYYNELKHVAGENSTVVQKELAVDEIKSRTSQANFMHTFEAYCAPFVVSPWIPMPNPTLQASYSPLGRSKLGAMRPVNTVIHGKRGFTTGDTIY
jgi:Ca2+-binding EF-hand superfamily protein